ncbi:RHS repeat-associated core domain-containing protein [Streptomyces griseoluteus]|uniref:RHS repeat-associated core domain-containing protein n=1 Tax=Streptomyces griseoluteus TaxID=29306 RepID=UPI0036FBAA7B
MADIDGNKVDTYTYSPRGVRILAQSTEPVAQPYRFAGNYQGPTGLCHLEARHYDASLGRFTQPDPSGQEQNPYLYAEGDPVNRICGQSMVAQKVATGGCAAVEASASTVTGACIRTSRQESGAQVRVLTSAIRTDQRTRGGPEKRRAAQAPWSTHSEYGKAFQMTAFFRLANSRPDGPSWSPYLMIGIFVVVAVVMATKYVKDKRNK